MNILIYLGILIVSIISLYFSNKFLKNLGIKVMVIIMNIISLILSFKYINLSTIKLNASIITYVTMFSALYLLLENNTLKETKKTININFLITAFVSSLLFLTTLHQESIIDSISINMRNVFRTNYRILISYPVATLISNYLLLYLYQKIKNLYDIPFITTVTTYLVIGLISTLIFHLGSYYHILTIKNILELSLSTYMIGLILTVIYSIFLSKIKTTKVRK